MYHLLPLHHVYVKVRIHLQAPATLLPNFLKLLCVQGDTSAKLTTDQSSSLKKKKKYKKKEEIEEKGRRRKK